MYMGQEREMPLSQFLDGLGINSWEVSSDDLRKLTKFFRYAGKRLLNAAFRSEGVKYKNPGKSSAQ